MNPPLQRLLALAYDPKEQYFKLLVQRCDLITGLARFCRLNNDDQGIDIGKTAERSQMRVLPSRGTRVSLR